MMDNKAVAMYNVITSLIMIGYFWKANAKAET